MASKVKTFSGVLVMAGCLCFVAIVLQTAGISTDYLQSKTIITLQRSSRTSTETRHWGLWNYCLETPDATKCYSLLNSDEYVREIIRVPILWKLFQAMHVVCLILLVAVFLLIVSQLCCLRYNIRSIVVAVTLSAIAGFLILLGCSVYASLERGFFVEINNSQLEYSFSLLVAVGVLASSVAVILTVAKCIVPKHQTRPTCDTTGQRHTLNDSIPTPAVISYKMPHRETQPNYFMYDDRREYHKTKQNSQPQSYTRGVHI